MPVQPLSADLENALRAYVKAELERRMYDTQARDALQRARVCITRSDAAAKKVLELSGATAEQPVYLRVGLDMVVRVIYDVTRRDNTDVELVQVRGTGGTP